MNKPLMAIVGRPNVGKSTLFNRILGERKSIVADDYGVTRDRIYEEADWCGHDFIMIDTGGIILDEESEIIPSLIREQAYIAMSEADVIVMVVDGKTGPTDEDDDIAGILRKTNKPVILCVNKLDSTMSELEMYGFYSLGFKDVLPISAEQARGIGDLLDSVVENFPVKVDNGTDDDTIRVSIIGRPNVGKSSLLNTLLGEERVIVSNVPGTTRDAINTYLEYEGQNFLLVDTAGLRRKARIDQLIERYSVLRTMRAIEKSDCVILVIDAVDGVTAQDKRVAGLADEAGCSCVIAVNKWDLVSKDNSSFTEYTKMIRKELDFINYAPVVFISAITKKRVDKLLPQVLFVAQEHSRRIPTPELNNFIRDIMMFHSPPSDKGKNLKVYYCTQVSVKPPTFNFYVNDPELMHFSYLRYLENNLRENYGFVGTPIRLNVKKKSGKKG